MALVKFLHATMSYRCVTQGGYLEWLAAATLNRDSRHPPAFCNDCTPAYQATAWANGCCAWPSMEKAQAEHRRQLQLAGDAARRAGRQRRPGAWRRELRG